MVLVTKPGNPGKAWRGFISLSMKGKRKKKVGVSFKHEGKRSGSERQCSDKKTG